jgi:hypothetical protein
MGNNRYDGDDISRMKPDLAERLRALEAENATLKSEVAMLTVDKLILKEVVDENDRGGVRNHSPGR